MSNPDQWTDLSSILASSDGKACLYGYLRAMDAGDSAPRCFHKYIALLDEVALLRRQADDRQQHAQNIVENYVTSRSAPAGLQTAAPSADQLRQLGQSAELFEPLEEAAREELKPFVDQFLRDVKRGEKTVRQRVKESGYLEFSEKLNGGKKKTNACTLC